MHPRMATDASEGAGGEGANDSLIHVDWMIGSGEMDLDGIRLRRDGAFDAQG